MIYRDQFGKEISRKKAYEKGVKLIQLMRLIYKPITEKEYKQLQKRREETKEIKKS
ncbi:MAG: hypothetical protein PHI88_02875 [Candidatus Pacebacteria bacterium]|nr:hypothetical protein [Candidatus Paceibacterota bacterium]